VSVVEYLMVPKQDQSNAVHARLIELSKEITRRGVTEDDYGNLDDLAHQILGI
jgi:hypothetical protein